jgi:hypothetical protein
VYSADRGFLRSLESIFSNFTRKGFVMNAKTIYFGILGSLLAATALSAPAKAQQAQKPNIILIVADDFGYGDSEPYGGGEGRGMPTPSLERMAKEGMTFFQRPVEIE